MLCDERRQDWVYSCRKKPSRMQNYLRILAEIYVHLLSEHFTVDFSVFAVEWTMKICRDVENISKPVMRAAAATFPDENVCAAVYYEYKLRKMFSAHTQIYKHQFFIAKNTLSAVNLFCECSLLPVSHLFVWIERVSVSLLASSFSCTDFSPC